MEEEQAPEAKFLSILFRFYSEILEQDMTESLWAEVLDAELGRYRIDSVPFYIPFIATDDIVSAEYDSEVGSLVYTQTLETSGNSIVWVAVLSNVVGIDIIQNLLAETGAISESLSDRYFSMEIHKDVNYDKVRDKLLELSVEGLIQFEEANISALHG